jgi:predicted RNase H-like HicB family nuclease
MRYAVVIEKGERNYSSYVPDLPGCVSVGDTAEQVKAEIREAIEFHLEGIREDGLPTPIEPGNRPRKSWYRAESAPKRKERLRRRIFPQMRQFHHGPQRHLPQLRHLRRHHGLQVGIPGKCKWRYPR